MAKPNVVSRDDLIQSAKKCIVEQGMQSLTLKSVAEGAGVTQGTVYYHFRNKEQLLLDIAKDVCQSSWESLERKEKPREQWIGEALESARSRTSKDSFYHQLFLSLVVSGFQNESIRRELGTLLEYENSSLAEQIASLRSGSPIAGLSPKTAGILFNALIDGLAIQALVTEDFPVDEVYGALKKMVSGFLTINDASEEKEK